MDEEDERPLTEAEEAEEKQGSRTPLVWDGRPGRLGRIPEPPPLCPDDDEHPSRGE